MLVSLQFSQVRPKTLSNMHFKYFFSIAAVLSFGMGDILSEIVADRGDSVTLQCADGVYWQTPSGQVFFNPNSTDFTITDIAAEDGGYYTCANEMSEALSTHVLYVIPYFTSHPPDIYTSNGVFESVRCFAEAFPSPSVYWLVPFGNTSGSGSGDQSSSGSGSGDQSMQQILEFNPVQFGDEGLYFCVASNEYGESTTSITVTSK